MLCAPAVAPGSAALVGGRAAESVDAMWSGDDNYTGDRGSCSDLYPAAPKLWPADASRPYAGISEIIRTDLESERACCGVYREFSQVANTREEQTLTGSSRIAAERVLCDLELPCAAHALHFWRVFPPS